MSTDSSRLVPRRASMHAGEMLVIARHAPVLLRLGLDTIAGAKAYNGVLVKNHRGHRDIFVIDTHDEAGAPLRLYLKRNLKAYKKDGVASVLRRGCCWSTSREEWENSLALQRAGIQTARLVAFGEECGPLWEKFSFIITERADGECTLEEFIGRCREARVRTQVFVELGRLIARMHDAGLASPDLFTRHIFVQPNPGAPSFCLIDMARLDHRKKLTPEQRARDLAALHVTAPQRHASTRERLRFLKAYCGKVDGRLIRLVESRTAHLLKRRKFRSFLE